MASSASEHADSSGGVVSDFVADSSVPDFHFPSSQIPDDYIPSQARRATARLSRPFTAAARMQVPHASNPRGNHSSSRRPDCPVTDSMVDSLSSATSTMCAEVGTAIFQGDIPAPRGPENPRHLMFDEEEQNLSRIDMVKKAAIAILPDLLQNRAGKEKIVLIVPFSGEETPERAIRISSREGDAGLVRARQMISDLKLDCSTMLSPALVKTYKMLKGTLDPDSARVTLINLTDGVLDEPSESNFFENLLVGGYEDYPHIQLQTECAQLSTVYIQIGKDSGAYNPLTVHNDRLLKASESIFIESFDDRRIAEVCANVAKFFGQKKTPAPVTVKIEGETLSGQRHTIRETFVGYPSLNTQVPCFFSTDYDYGHAIITVMLGQEPVMQVNMPFPPRGAIMTPAGDRFTEDFAQRYKMILSTEANAQSAEKITAVVKAVIALLRSINRDLPPTQSERLEMIRQGLKERVLKYLGAVPEINQVLQDRNINKWDDDDALKLLDEMLVPLIQRTQHPRSIIQEPSFQERELDAAIVSSNRATQSYSSSYVAPRSITRALIIGDATGGGSPQPPSVGRSHSSLFAAPSSSLPAPPSGSSRLSQRASRGSQLMMPPPTYSSGRGGPLSGPPTSSPAGSQAFFAPLTLSAFSPPGSGQADRFAGAKRP